MTAPIFRTKRRIEFADTDMAGIVHFSNFFRFMESAEMEFLRSQGLSVAMRWQDQRLGFPRVAASADFMKPVGFQDIVEISVSVERIGEKSVTYAFEFTKDGELIATGRIVACCCRVFGEHQIEPVEIPQAIRDILEGKAGQRESYP
jgi:YbgC/YbaW family acyl-CoA thioester hydrolase